MDEVEIVRTDGDSHTSVALLAVVFDEIYGQVPEIRTLNSTDVNGSDTPPDTVLLIGDKVVRNQPDPALFPHQLDLGEAWRGMTGLPFVFACWMARTDRDLGTLPDVLSRYCELNRTRVGEIAGAHAEASGWPEELAAEYLGEILCYEIGSRELEAIELFWQRCHELGLIERLRPLKLYK
jgi:chorismate dehydratase